MELSNIFCGNMSTSNEVSRNAQFPECSTAKKVNNLLNSSKTRWEGLELLNSFLPQCSDEDFLNFCVSWMQNCCKIDGLTKNRDYPARLLCDLLKSSWNYPELKKSVSFFITTRYFDFFFKHLLHSEAGWLCTETCLCLYRGACGPFHESLVKYLTDEVEKNARIPLTVAHCFALLPSAGGGGNDGVSYRQNWKSQFVKFLSICHSILNDLLADEEEFKLQDYEALERGHKSNGNERHIKHLSIQFQNYCSILDFMLLNQYPASKNVPSDLVFQLICRGLAVNPKVVGRRQTTDVVSLQEVLPDVHRALLSLLKAIIVTCKNQLLPYAHLVCKLIKQSLQWTESDCAYGIEKPFGRFRVSIYETLCDWMVVTKSGSCVEVISDVVVSNAVSDIRPKRGIVSIKEAKSLNHHNRRERVTRRIDVTSNSTLCYSALKALQFLLKFTGILLKAEVHKFLQEFVVKLLVEIQKSSTFETVIPFSAVACRTELYRLLLELIHQPCPKWPPPTHFALRLFARGFNDAAPQVSSFCSSALNYTTIIIHPQYDNGGFPPRDGPDQRIRREDEPGWWRVEPMEVAMGTRIEISQEEGERNKENQEKPDDISQSKKANDANEGSEFSSDEDSRNTVTFSKEAAELTVEALRVEEVSLRQSPTAAEEEYKQEEGNRREIVSPITECLGDASCSDVRGTPKTHRKCTESEHAVDSSGPKSVSPESGSEDGHRKGRYYLRSKTKASSEEPEETLKRTCSPECTPLKGTPVKTSTKMTPGVQNSKRPRTRALSKIEGGGETPGKNGADDEEDIKAAFDDSFVD